MSDLRPSWDDYGLALAKAASTRADCTRRKVGAVILDIDHRVIAAGYNGAGPGGQSCLAGECPRGKLTYDQVPAGSSYDTGAGSCIATHAEANCLLYSDPLRRQGGTMYVTDAPCDGCFRLLRNSGLAQVISADGGYIRFAP